MHFRTSSKHNEKFPVYSSKIERLILLSQLLDYHSDIREVDFFPHVLHCQEIKIKLKENSTITRNCSVSVGQHCLYYYMRDVCNLIGLEQWYFRLI